jgi:hypothetical protein
LVPTDFTTFLMNTNKEKSLKHYYSETLKELTKLIEANFKEQGRTLEAVTRAFQNINYKDKIERDYFLNAFLDDNENFEHKSKHLFENVTLQSVKEKLEQKNPFGIFLSKEDQRKGLENMLTGKNKNVVKAMIIKMNNGKIEVTKGNPSKYSSHFPNPDYVKEEKLLRAVTFFPTEISQPTSVEIVDFQQLTFYFKK